MRCYKCGKDLATGAATCPACGQQVYTVANGPGSGLGRRLDGCLPDTPSTRHYTAVPNVSSLPPRVDLRPGCSPVEDQGQVGSCTANAIVGAVEFKRWKRGRQEDLSRLFVYYNARRLSGLEGRDSGVQIAHGMAAFLAYGAPPERTWPYDPARVNVMPDAAAFAAATENAEVEYARVEGIEHIKGALARQQPVVFAASLPVRCYEEASRTGEMPIPTSAEIDAVRTQYGRHAMLLVGYDADRNVFHVRNSWGPSWGDQGYCRLSIDTFQQTLAANTAWVVGSLEPGGAFSVTRPTATAATTPPSTPVEGSVRDRSGSLRDDIRGSLNRDLDAALKGIRDRTPKQGQ